MFKVGESIDIYAGSKKICSGSVKDVDGLSLVIEKAGLPIKYVGQDVEVRHGDSKFKGAVFAFGKGCIDKDTDLVTVVCVARHDDWGGAKQW